MKSRASAHRLQSHRARTHRLRIAVVATIVTLGAGVAALGADAQASTQGQAPQAATDRGLPKISNVTVPHIKPPRNAVRASHGLPAVGSHGAPFQKPGGGVQPNIVGGTAANASDFPYIVGIETLFLADDGTGQLAWFIATCTGTVIAPTKVLTAGHCDTDLPFGTTAVIAGRNNIDNETGGFVARVASTWTHQGFNLAALNAGNADVPVDDVAVLTLQQPLPNVYTPIALTAQGDQTPYAAGTSATIAGYGITAAGASDSGTLFKATVPVQSDATCRAAMGTGYDSTRMTCAGPPEGGVDTCNGDSGGPLVVGGVEVGITDWGAQQCAAPGTFGVFERLSTYHDAITADFARPPLVNLDFSGDGHSDLLARDGSGNLWEYSGSGFANDGFGGFGGGGIIGSGWNIYTKLFRVTNWTGDGTESVMAEDSAGNLFLYATDGAGDFAPGQRALVGTGWNTFSDIMVVNNWTGDGHPNLLARNSRGDLFLYTSDGHGGWLNNGIGIKVGTGWNIFNTILTPGTWRGQGHQALIGRTANGDLLLYESDGSGGWLNGGVGIRIGTGWNAFSIFMSPGDWNGDNMVDVLGITPAGVVKLYETDAHGNWLNGGIGQQIGSGWNTFNAVF